MPKINHSTLTVTNLCKAFGARQVVREVSLALRQGDIIGLLGPNGAGKTTTFYMILGLIRCDQGSIILDQRDITQLPIHERAQLGLGYLPQEPSVFRKLTVAENILAILELQPGLSKPQQQARLNALIDEFKLNDIRDVLGIQLSGGERRRLEIARALASEPGFILLDEPFAGVDPISIQEIKTTIEYLAHKGIGVIITDHNVRETLAICHRGYILNQGGVLATGTPAELLANAEVRDVYLGATFAL